MTTETSATGVEEIGAVKDGEEAVAVLGVPGVAVVRVAPAAPGAQAVRVDPGPEAQEVPGAFGEVVAAMGLAIGDRRGAMFLRPGPVG